MKKLLIIFISILLMCLLVSCRSIANPENELHTHEWVDEIILRGATREKEGVLLYICTCGEVKSGTFKYTSSGFEYTLNEDGKSYSIIGLGTCTDTDVVIPAVYNELPVTSIGNYAFYDCARLTSVTIPNSVTSIGGAAFGSCDSLTSINVSDENTTYKSINGNLYSKDGKTLIQYAMGKTDSSFIIPDSVTNIGYGAFMDCASLTSMTIPNSVTSIGNEAFFDCSNLTSITIPNSVTNIGTWAFYNCTSLNDVYYTGSEEQWNLLISKSNCNIPGTANIHYNYSADE